MSDTMSIALDSFLRSLASNEAVISISVNDAGRVTAYETKFFWVPLYSGGELVENRPDNGSAERVCVLRDARASRVMIAASEWGLAHPPPTR